MHGKQNSSPIQEKTNCITECVTLHVALLKMLSLLVVWEVFVMEKQTNKTD